MKVVGKAGGEGGGGGEGVTRRQSVSSPSSRPSELNNPTSFTAFNLIKDFTKE